MLRHFISAVSLCCFLAAPTQAQLPRATTERLNRVFDSVCRGGCPDGISACIIIPGKGAWTAVHGTSSEGMPIKPDMAMGISSNTKTFIATLMLRLQEMHLLSLDDNIGKWIAPRKNIKGDITIRQLLNHTSGIFDFTEHPHFIDSLSLSHRLWRKEELLGLVRKPKFKPGKGWDYSNTNYVLAGIIIERVMNKPIEQVLQDILFYPLALHSSFYYPWQIPTNEIAHPWTVALGHGPTELSIADTFTTTLFSMASSSGAIMQTAEDNARFWSLLFSGKVINSNSLAQMLDFVDIDDDDAAGYGLGLNLFAGKSAINGRTGYGHGGTNIGYVSQNLVDSASGVSYSILTNQDVWSEDDLLYKLIAPLQLAILSDKPPQ